MTTIRDISGPTICTGCQFLETYRAATTFPQVFYRCRYTPQSNSSNVILPDSDNIPKSYHCPMKYNSSILASLYTSIYS